MNEQPTHFVIPAGVLNGILQYLMSRPYGEVAQGIAALQSLQPTPPSEAESAPAHKAVSKPNA